MPNEVHPINQRFIPALRFDDYPPRGTGVDAQIAARHWRYVLAGESLSRTRDSLATYPNARCKLAAFDRALMQFLVACGPRPAPFVP